MLARKFLRIYFVFQSSKEKLRIRKKAIVMIMISLNYQKVNMS